MDISRRSINSQRLLPHNETGQSLFSSPPPYVQGASRGTALVTKAKLKLYLQCYTCCCLLSCQEPPCFMVFSFLLASSFLFLSPLVSCSHSVSEQFTHKKAAAAGAGEAERGQRKIGQNARQYFARERTLSTHHTWLRWRASAGWRSFRLSEGFDSFIPRVIS